MVFPGDPDYPGQEGLVWIKPVVSAGTLVDDGINWESPMAVGLVSVVWKHLWGARAPSFVWDCHRREIFSVCLDIQLLDGYGKRQEEMHKRAVVSCPSHPRFAPYCFSSSSSPANVL